MDTNTPIVSISRNGHTFDFVVTTDERNETHIECIIDGNTDDPIRAHLDVALPTETRPETCHIARIPRITLRVNGEDRKCDAIRLTDEEHAALAAAKNAQEIAVSNDIISRAISGNPEFVFSVNRNWETPEITVWKKYPDGNYIKILEAIPDALPEINLREIEDGEIENVHPTLQHSGYGYDFLHIITPEEREILIRVNAERKEAREAAERKAEEEYQREKTELLNQVDSWEITEKKITDEGGKTTMYIHTFVIGGRKYTFSERNVFDVGVVINPRYKEALGFAVYYDGKYRWAGSENERELTADEILCVQIISKYGKFSSAGIRM